MRTSTFLGPALVVAASAQGALGWGAAGHEIAATIAQMHLHPSVLPQLCTILAWNSDFSSDSDTTGDSAGGPPCHIASIAAWADRIRFRKRWSAALHYVGAVGDHPSSTCLFPGTSGWAGRDHINVLGGIRNTTEILSGWRYSVKNQGGRPNIEVMDEALRFLVHFMGDVHMPLHLTGRDRGGNGDKVLFDGRQTNLHSLWDGLLIAKSLRTIPRNYTLPLPLPSVERHLRGAIYDPYIRRIIHEGVLGRWEGEIDSWFDCPATSNAHTMGEDAQIPLGAMGTAVGGADEDTDLICPFAWAQPIHALNCAFVWPKQLDEPPYNGQRVEPSHAHDEEDCGCSSSTLADDLQFLSSDTPERTGFVPRPGFNTPPPHIPLLELDTPQYAGYIAQNFVVEKLLAQAGIRMAGVLNYLFADDEEEEFGVRLGAGLEI